MVLVAAGGAAAAFDSANVSRGEGLSMAVPMSKRLSSPHETEKSKTPPIELIAHGDGWENVPYIRRDIYDSKLTVLNLQRGDLLIVHLTDEARDALHLDRLSAMWSDLAGRMNARAVIVTGVDRFSILRPGEESGDEA